MAQWYFGDASSKFRPYVGAGINYTTFFDNGFNVMAKEAELRSQSRKILGSCRAGGVDYLINRDWLVNMSCGMDIDTTANYKLGGAQQHDGVRLDPWCLCSQQDIVFNSTKTTPHTGQ